jgi:hypothetical protein
LPMDGSERLSIIRLPRLLADLSGHNNQPYTEWSSVLNAHSNAIPISYWIIRILH